MEEEVLDFDITFKENTEVPTIEEQVIVNSIKNFTDEGSRPAEKIYTNILDAFDFEYANKNGGIINVKMQKNKGKLIPTIVGKNQTALNLIKPSLYKGQIAIFQLAYELEIDINQIEDGDIDATLSVEEAQTDLETIAMSLMITGVATDEKLKQRLSLLKNSFFDVGKVSKSPFDLIKKSAKEIVTFISSEIGNIKKAGGGVADTLIISDDIWRAIQLADTNLDQFTVQTFLTEKLNLNIFVVPEFDDVGKYGPCMAIFKKDVKMLKGYIGRAPFVRENKKSNTNEYPAIFMSIGGFQNLVGNSGSISIVTNLSEEAK